MNRIFLLTAVIVAALTLAACSDDDPPAPTVTSNGETITGAWTTGCQAFGGGASGLFTLNFAGNGVSFNGTTFLSDATCTGGADTTESGSATLDFIGTKTASGGEVVSTADTTETAASMTANTAVGAISLLATSDYGFTDWAAGISHDILGLDETGATVPTAGKDIIFIDEAATPDTLQFGLEVIDSGTLDAAGYPNTVDTFIFHR